MKIAIATDHAGLPLKKIIIEHLTKTDGYEIIDFGLFEEAPAADYPDFGLAAAEAVSVGDCDIGVIVCGTGIGMSICANKVKGVRCAVCCDRFSAEATRLHNNANVLALGARLMREELALEILDTFLSTPFSGEERHQRRIDKITAIEKKYFK